jgi:hypothetical protein
MRAFRIAAISHCWRCLPSLRETPPNPRRTKLRTRRRKRTEEVEGAYKDMLKRTTREQPARKADPWANLR